MKDKIAVVILNYIQYINIKIGIEELKRRGYIVDIYCPKVDTDDGFKEMFDKTRHFLKENNYSVYDKVTNKSYKVLLEPYPCMDISAKYKIRYRYGMLSAKPNKVYIPDNYLMYDGLLCGGINEAKYLQAYSNTHLVSNMKYVNYKHFKKNNKKNNEKKILLYLPTYGEESSIDIICDKLNELRKKYYVITKIHHGTSFLKDELIKINKLKNSVDEFYDCFKDLIDLLARADIVLTDNSGSIFEAMYAKVPVAVYCDDINKNKIGEFDTIQYDLYKDKILPYTNKNSKIDSIINEALSKKCIEKQNKWAKENLYYSDNPSNDFANIIEDYMNDRIDVKYNQLHRVLSDYYYKMIEEYNNNLNEIEEMKNSYKILTDKYNSLKNRITKYENGKLYKLSHKIYLLYRKLRGKINEK